MSKIAPFLWFDTHAEEAMNYYVSVFNGSPKKKEVSKIVSITRYEKGMQVPDADKMEGKVLTGIFELAGQRFMALDGGPIFTFTEAISLYVECDGQEEVDYFWSKLSAVPTSEQCGWCKDKFGLSWQIIPKQMGDMMKNSNPATTQRVVNAMLTMKKIVIADLEKARNATQ